jgi:dephospho-CoA kinase
MPRRETANSKRFPPAKGSVSIFVLCGPSGAGKSTLAAAMERRGWLRLDGDALAKSLYTKGSGLLREMAQTFGQDILRPNGILDTVRLGEIVFPSLARRKKLTRLVYPRFERALRAKLAEARRQGQRLVADVPVYFDMGAPALGVPVVLLNAPIALRVARLRQARGLSAASAKAQATALRFGPQQRRRADVVLDGRKPKAKLLQDLVHALGMEKA